MASSGDSDIAKEFPFFRVYKDGHIEFWGPPCDKVPASDDNTASVQSKDAIISSDPPVSARIFIPKLKNTNQTFPLLLYVHGGGFCTQSAFSTEYNRFCNTVSAQADAIVVSVEYGLFPDRPIPACYEDSWSALKWVASHVGGNGPEPWLNDHADFDRVFIGGDSAGGNISHTLAFRVGTIGLPGVKVVGVIMVHPFFGGTKDDEMWLFMCPVNGGLQDPRLKPPAEDTAKLGCGKVLIFVADKDYLSPVGIEYYEDLQRSGWKGTAELVEQHGVGHVFFLSNPTDEKAVELTNKFVSFIIQH